MIQELKNSITEYYGKRNWIDQNNVVFGYAKPKQAHKEYLCNADCNNCEAIENKQLAVLLNVLALKFGEEVWHITNRVCANMTCCPICHIDDFCHDCADAKSGIAAIDEIGDANASCEVAEMAKEIFKEFNKQ